MSILEPRTTKVDPFNEESKEEVQEEIKEEKQEDKQEESEETVYTAIEAQGGPPEEIITQWKQQFGEVSLLPIGEDKLFIYRNLKRSEWNQLKTTIFNNESITEDAKKIHIVTRCLLWPQLDSGDFNLLEAGLPEALYDAISFSSCFLPEQMIVNLIVKL